MKTEIFGTFGPACEDEKILKEMIDAGMTGMRLNLSHTTLSASENYIRNYQKAASEVGVVPQILIDMQGPELRVGKLEETVELVKDHRVRLCAECDARIGMKFKEQICDEMGEIELLIPIPEEVIETAEVGDEILLDDGKILVQVVDKEVHEKDAKRNHVREKEEKSFVAKVIRGGVLRSHKSIKIVGKNVKMPALTEHDIENIKRAKAYGVTALMQPFVLSGADLRYVRQVLKEYDAQHIKIFAKIENRLGVENIEDILPEADVIIIARGDLGNDMPLWELPKVQKEIENACHKSDKPYIVVTQMLASMEENPVPTRAEVSDIFYAVFCGAYGIMVTGETAIGKYPVEAIRYLTNTAKEAEQYIRGNLTHGSKSK